jgi:hypothetical protein
MVLIFIFKKMSKIHRELKTYTPEEKKLSYDFYLPDINTLIEYQGLQHSKPYNFGADLNEEDTQDRFKKQKVHDKLKKEYAKKNGYNLVEIWHWDFKNIDSILSKVTNI